MAMVRRFLTDAEKEYLKREYPLGDLDKICEKLGIKRVVLYQKAAALGLRRDPEMVLEKNKQLGRALGEKCLGKRFESGFRPANKGKKLTEWASPEAIERMCVGRKKKGSVPPNRKEIGSERITSGYVQVKVQDGCGNANYKAKHHVVWEQHHGKIPKGSIVEFIDGDVFNFSIENLRCVTRRENVQRNGANYRELPQDLKDVIKLNNKLNQLLK